MLVAKLVAGEVCSAEATVADEAGGSGGGGGGCGSGGDGDCDDCHGLLLSDVTLMPGDNLPECEEEVDDDVELPEMGPK